ncbi:MAG: response regulator [candidate division Zixibacteria bacterium]|nr:response regulator [candidate division Zixibacteria bacterium]
MLYKILLIYADENVTAEITDTLGGESYSYEIALSNKQAVKIIENDPYIDLIITCGKMQTSSNINVLQFVKKNIRYQNIPILITCPDCNRERILEFAKMGANGIVVYPFDSSKLKEKVDLAIKEGRRAVLIVDDEEEIINILKYVIELERFKVYSALNAEDGLKILAENPVHIVVSDILLPKMNGMDFMTTIKKKYKDIPVILITGYAGRFSPEMALTAGADGYFQKPFKNTELVQKLRQVLANYEKNKVLEPIK